MRILVTGATGTTGREVLNYLLKRPGVDVFALTRSPERAQALPAGVTPIVGDLLDPPPLRAVFKGMDALFLLLAGVPSEGHQGLTAVALAREAGIGRIVYLTVHETPAVPRHVPHIGAKLLVEEVIRDSGIPFTFIQPNFFMQNDLSAKDPMLEHGIYPFPLGDAGVSCCDVRDIAEASVAALVDDGHAGEAYTIAGPEALTGSEIAAIWSDALGRPVRYGGHDMATWEAAQIERGLPSWHAYDLNLMFREWQKGLVATPAELSKLARVLGHEPRTYRDFARETARAWGLNPD